MTPYIPPFASLKFVQSTTFGEPIANGAGAIPQYPSVEKWNNLEPAFGPAGEFVAPCDGLYSFNTSANLDLPGGGFFDVSIEDTARGESFSGRGGGADLVPAKCSTTLKLKEGDTVRRLISLYNATADGQVRQDPGTNFYEITYRP